ncbi:hypothetical protein VZF83_01290 [Synechococcus elongatus IITB3]
MEVRCWIVHTLKRIGTEAAIDALYGVLHELPAEELERSYLSRPTSALLLDGINQPFASAGEKLVSVFLSEGDRSSDPVKAYAMGVLGEFLECYRIALPLPESLVSQAEHYAFSGNARVVTGAVKLLTIAVYAKPLQSLLKACMRRILVGVFSKSEWREQEAVKVVVIGR